MSKKIYIGIDNGVSGSIGIIAPDTTLFIPTPTKSQQDYTKAKKNVTRVDYDSLKGLLSSLNTEDVAIVGLERPMVNPSRFVATASALRALEATLICLEGLGMPHLFIDSKEWQKELLPKGVKGASELKKASLDIGNRLYPQFKENSLKDRDGLLIAHYLKSKY